MTLFFRLIFFISINELYVIPHCFHAEKMDSHPLRGTLHEVPSLECINLNVSAQPLPEEEETPRHHLSLTPAIEEPAKLSKYPSEALTIPHHKRRCSTGSLGARLLGERDFEDATPSEVYEQANYLPDISVHIARVRQLRMKPSPRVAPLLELWAEATSLSMLQSNNIVVPQIVWADLTEATANAAPKMKVADFVELLKIWATAMHRCGPRLEPPAVALAAIADGARAAFQSRQHTLTELQAFQAAIGDVLRVVAMGGAAGTRSRRRKIWGESLSTKLLPMLAVGISVVHSAYKAAAQELASGKADPNQIAHYAVFFANALGPIAYCPRSAATVLDVSSTTVQRDATLLSCLMCVGPSCGSVAPSNSSATKSSTAEKLPAYDYLLAKIQARAATIADWLNGSLTPAAHKVMNLRALDKFMSALVAAAGDEELPAEKCPSRSSLIRCAAKALREAARRVHSAQAGQQVVSVRSVRRLAATARKNWEVAASAEGSVAREVASCTAYLERFVASKEEEQDAATRAEIHDSIQRL